MKWHGRCNDRVRTSLRRCVLSLVSPVSLLQTLVFIPRLADNPHKGSQRSQPLFLLSGLGVWKAPTTFRMVVSPSIVQNNPIHVISNDASENEAEYTLICTCLVKIVLSSQYEKLHKNNYK